LGNGGLAYIALAYVIGFFVMLAILGWNPSTDHKTRVDLSPTIHPAGKNFAEL
jgi:hypothetical protein